MKCRISSRNYISTRTKMVPSDSQPFWVAYTNMTFDLAFELKGQIQDQGTGYWISSQSYVSTLTKTVSSDSQPFSAAHTTMTSDPALDLQSQIEGQMPDQRYHCCVTCLVKLAVVCDHFGMRADVISRRYLIPRPLTLNLTLKDKFQVKGYGCVGCCSESLAMA